MIRMNLLKGRPGEAKGIQSVVWPSRSTPLVSRFELLLGALFLLLGCLILISEIRNADHAAVSAGDEDGGGGPQTSEVLAPAVPPGSAEVRPVADARAAAEIVPATTSEAIPGIEAAHEAQTPTPLADSDPAPPPPPAPTVTGVTPEESQEANLASEPQLMSSVFVTSREDSVRIFVATGSYPKYEAFQLNNPNRVVVDLPGVRVSLPSNKRQQAVSHPLIKRVRAAQYRVDPPIARVVLDVPAFPDIEYLPQFNGLYIKISETAE